MTPSIVVGAMLGAFVLLAPVPASAQSSPDPSIEVTFATRGMSKGLAQTDDEPQLVVRSELALRGFYIGATAKNVTSSSSDGEAAALAGWRGKAGGLDLAAGVALKRALATSAPYDRSAVELSAAVSRGFGKLTPKLSLAWSPDDLGGTGRTLFAEAGATYKFSKQLIASAAVGRRERDGGLDYTAYNAGLSWIPVKPLTLDLRYYDTNRDAGQPYAARLVGSLRTKF